MGRYFVKIPMRTIDIPAVKTFEMICEIVFEAIFLYNVESVKKYTVAFM